jgi:RNA polymerase sigma factor (sigma-70 family)
MPSARMPTDADFVSTLYRTHYVGLCRTARLLVDDTPRAEELVQDAFTRTLEGKHVQPEAALAYVRRAVVNACHSELRRRRVERRIGIGDRRKSLDAAAPLVDSRHPVQDIGDRDAVSRLIGTLPARQREAVVLRYYADLDEASIAAAMRCSVGTVKSQLARARRQLTALLSIDEEQS